MTTSTSRQRPAIRLLQDPLWLAMIGVALGLTLLVPGIALVWGSGPVLVQLPWYIPLISAFTALTTLSIAYLALGRYWVLHDSTSFWIGSGFAVYSIGQIFYGLTWPGVLPGGSSVLGHLPNTPAWIVLVDLTLLAAFLLTAVLRGDPAKPIGPAWNRPFSIGLLFLGAVIGFGLLVYFESDLPVLVTPDGTFRTPLRVWTVLLLILFSAGSILSSRYYRRSQDKLVGYVAFPQMALIFICIMVLIGGKRYDLWWYLQRIVLVGGYLLVLFGLLSEYIRLFRRESEGRRTLEALLEHIPIGLSLSGGPPDFSSVWMSRYGREMNQAPPGSSMASVSPLNQAAWQVFLPDGVTQPSPEERPVYRASRLGEEVHNAEYILQMRDGRRIPVLVNAAPVRDARGTITAAISTWVDITDRKRSEDLLRQSEALYRAIARSIPNGAVYVVDKDLRYMIAEGPVAEKAGFGRAALEGRTVSEIFDPDTAARMAARFQRVFAGETISYETEENGRIYWTQHARIDHPASHAVVITLDITDRKLAEKVLSETQQRFQAIINQTTAGVVRTDLDGRFVFVSRVFSEMIGFSEEELIGKTIWQFTHPEDVEENRRLFERLVGKGKPYQLEKRLVRQDGSILWINVSASPVLDEVGRAQSAVSIIIDITERKEAEEALHQLNLQLENRVNTRTAQLQASNDALRESRQRLQILSQRLVEVQEEERRAIARELHDRAGQTLAALNINLMIMNGQLSEDSKARIGSRLGDSMSLVAEAIALIRDVMTDLRPAVLEDYGLEAAVQSYIEHYQTRYPIRVQMIRSSPPIPRLEPSMEMTLLRIAQEALTNVARHANTDQATVSIQLEAGAICLRVQDKGVGLGDLQIKKHPESHGMRIMRERAEAFGGSVTIRSEPGQGTTVEATIPIEQPAQAESQQPV